MPWVPDVIMLGQFPLAMVAVLSLLGGTLAYWLSGWLARREGHSSEAVHDVVVNLIVGGVISAKLVYVVLDPAGYWQNPLALLIFPYGRLGVLAGLLGGAVVVAWTLRRNPDRLTVLDLASAPLVLAAAVGSAGWHSPGSWAFAPALLMAGAGALAFSLLGRAPAPGHRAAQSLIVVAFALAVADLARPGGATTNLQWAAALAGTAAWLWLQRAWKKDSGT